MLKTSDLRHEHNHHLRPLVSARPRVKADKNAVNVRRQIEDIVEQRRLNAAFDL